MNFSSCSWRYRKGIYFECAVHLDDNTRSQDGVLCCFLDSCYSSQPWPDYAPQNEAFYHPHMTSVCNIKNESDTGKCLSAISLGIIGEGPMLNKLCLEPPQDMDKKFGGKAMLMISSSCCQCLRRQTHPKIVNTH